MVTVIDRVKCLPSPLIDIIEKYCEDEVVQVKMNSSALLHHFRKSVIPRAHLAGRLIAVRCRQTVPVRLETAYSCPYIYDKRDQYRIHFQYDFIVFIRNEDGSICFERVLNMGHEHREDGLYIRQTESLEPYMWTKAKNNGDQSVFLMNNFDLDGDVE